MRKLFYVAALALVFAGCKKDDSSTPGTTPTPVVKSKYISCVIDGKKYTYTEGTGGYKNNQYFAALLSSAFYTSFLEIGNSSSPTNAMAISLDGAVFFGNSPTYDEFKTYFGTGSFHYSNDTESGISFSFYDNTGNEWSSYYYTDQTASTFTITSSKPRQKNGDSFIDVEGVFSCTLDDSNGNTKNVTNGKFYITFANQ